MIRAGRGYGRPGQLLTLFAALLLASWVATLATSSPGLAQWPEPAAMVVFWGEPGSRTVSSLAHDSRVELTTEERLRSQLLITLRNGEYFWANRGDKPLVYVAAGRHHMFISRDSGYVRVLDLAATDIDANDLPPGAPGTSIRNTWPKG